LADNKSYSGRRSAGENKYEPFLLKIRNVKEATCRQRIDDVLPTGVHFQRTRLVNILVKKSHRSTEGSNHSAGQTLRRPSAGNPNIGVSNIHDNHFLTG
jgi:hypothetical protein